MRWPWVCGALCTLAVLAGCGQGRVSLAQGPRTYTAQQYETVLRRWTRTGHDYVLQGLDDQITATATYESWDFRWAYVVRYADDFRLATAERTQLLQTSLEAAQREHEFYVAMYTVNRRWGELTRPTSAWRILLVDDQQHEVAPVSVEPVNRPGALERTYFPYSTVWRQVYRVRFPRRVNLPGRGEVDFLHPGMQFFILRFAGPLGHTDLVWDLSP